MAAIEAADAFINSLPTSIVPLRPVNILGVQGLRLLLASGSSAIATPLHNGWRPPEMESLEDLVADIERQGNGVIMTMGKGGVGKTTVAAAIAVMLAKRGHSVHLSTTDPAAHVAQTLAGQVAGLTLSKIDPAVETAAYQEEVMTAQGAAMDAAGRSLLEEDLRSPCTEEIAVFRAFAREVGQGTNSPTLERSLALVNKARATVKSSRGDLFPALYATGSAARSTAQATAAGLAGGGAVNTISAVVDASWEVDLFGGTRRNIEASQARLEGAEADWNDARVTLAAEVAHAYATARAYQARIALYQAELASRQATEELTRLKIEAGSSPVSDALQINASTASAAGNLENERGRYEQALNQLVMLTALPYEAVQATLGATKVGTIPSIKTPSSPGIPTAVLAQRPDIRSAERSVAAASANIGVAIADALPSLTLGGSIGINSSRSSATHVSARTWSVGPDLSIPLFTGGKTTAAIDSARADYQRTVASFRSEVLVAVQETEDALVQIDASDRRIGHAREAAKRYQEFFRAQEESYKAGRGSLLDLEDARRLSLASQVSLQDVQLSQAQAWISLYKAAGGGWQ